jgi:hypothetical protein
MVIYTNKPFCYATFIQTARVKIDNPADAINTTMVGQYYLYDEVCFYADQWNPGISVNCTRALADVNASSAVCEKMGINIDSSIS